MTSAPTDGDCRTVGGEGSGAGGGGVRGTTD